MYIYRENVYIKRENLFFLCRHLEMARLLGGLLCNSLRVVAGAFASVFVLLARAFASAFALFWTFARVQQVN